jgi:hypothetical protein
MAKTVSQILQEAVDAHHRKAAELWERDGRRDCGSCGGACLYLDKRSTVCRAGTAMGLVDGNSGAVLIRLPDGIRTQNADVYQDSLRAFRDVLIATRGEEPMTTSREAACARCRLRRSWLRCYRRGRAAICILLLVPMVSR